ncbi:ferrous iron transport protein B [Cellulomonas hominis]
MSSCHETPGGVALATTEPSVVLVGNPNVGKSTLFNTLTGSRQKVMNAPGTTVELQTGTWRGITGRGSGGDRSKVRLVDLPGTYSLLARSPDERVTAETVAGTGDLDVPDLAVVLIEAAALSRSLYLLAQVARTGQRAVVALTMNDVAAARGLHVDPVRLAAVLGAPVVPIDPRTGAGLPDLSRTVQALLHGAAPGAIVPSGVTTSDSAADGDCCCDADSGVASLDALARAARTEAAAPADDLDAEIARADLLFGWVDSVVRSLEVDEPAPAGQPAPGGCPVTPGRSPRVRPAPALRTRSDRIDRVLLDPWFGIPVFLAVMWAMFQLATTVAAPLIDGVDGLVNGTLAGWLHGWIPGPAWVAGFLVDGVIAGVGTVLSFVPLMALVFLAIAVLEDSGYLARAAFVADRAMRAIGLDGRAMLPLVVGFGCNLPALAATKTLPTVRQRLLTGLLIPYTSCPARLTVYILLSSVFFPDRAGTAIFAMYVASIVLVVLGGLVLRRTAFRDIRREPLVLALPAYQRPRARALLLSAWVRCRSFVTKAGSIIVTTLAVVWVLMAVPVTGQHALADVPVEDSLYGQAAEAVAPVFGPAGFDDWHASAALVTGFVAKEVVVGAFAQSYAVDEPEDPSASGDLGSRLQATFDRTSDGHPAAAALAFMVFVLAYTPCLATVGEQRRLFGGRWTTGAVLVQLTIAWMLAVAVFQVGRLL